MKIGIVGAGMVGSAAAYACIMRGVGSEIVLVDRNRDLARAQADDILHATPFAYPVDIYAGDYQELNGAEIVIITAGVTQEPGETRLSLLDRNAQVFGEVIPQILTYAKNPILLIATNPCDIMTQIATAIATSMSDMPSSRIIGSGTILDTARFRALLGKYLGVSAKSIHGYVLGEHGDSEVLHWSAATSGTIKVEELAKQIGKPLTEEAKLSIDQGVRGAAGNIIEGKGATWYGIGGGIARICQIIQNDEKSVVTCSMVLPEVEGVKQVALSLPSVVGREGIIRTLKPQLNKEERAALKESASILRGHVDSLLGPAG